MNVLDILENCDIPHLFGKVIRDDSNEIVKFEIKHTNLDKIKLFNEYFSKLNEDDAYWLDIFKKVIKLKKVNLKRYSPRLDTLLSIEIYSPCEDDIVLWISIDYDEEVRKQEERENMCEMILDSVPDGVFFKGLDHKFLKCNNSYLDIIGHTREEVEHNTIIDICDNVSIAREIVEIDKDIIKTGKEIVYYQTLTRKDGSIIEIETLKKPFYGNKQRPVGIIGVARDITLRKNQEKELENLRMEFFANISHEFRTPINLIFSSIQLIRILNKRIGYSNENKKYVDIIEDNSYRLLKLVNNLIDTTKINSGYFEYNPKNRNIIKFIDEICQSVYEYAKKKGINILFSTEVEEKVISFDGEQLERVILNLVSNAIKFTKEDGIVDISISCDNDFVKIIIRDNGVGIPKDKLEHIFDKLIQINSRMTKISEGSGIGLSIVKSLIEINGGTIDVKSKLNIGTEFIIKLPNKLIEENEDNQLYFDIVEEEFKHRIAEKMKIEFSDIY